MRRMLMIFLSLVLSVGITIPSLAASRSPRPDARLKGAFRRAPESGWTYVHLEGSPGDIGYQNGYLLAPEIADLQKVFAMELKHDNHKDWSFFRDAARNMMWPHVEQEYRDELQGIADGLKARGVRLDLWDVVAMNADPEWGYYVGYYDKTQGAQAPPTSGAQDHCSAFVATGSYTKDGRVVIAHNDWTSYLDGSRWTIIYDIAPESGYHILMDGLPGLIHSADDFGINSAGILITETTITGFHGYDPAGIPEFVRARKAMQYSASIDDFARIMKEGNNGGYANDWLIADRKTNEIASLELGLKNVTLERKSDGYFVSANFPIDPKLMREETNFNPDDAGNSEVCRHKRWEQLMAEYKGRIDVGAAQKFLADHYDTYTGKTEPSERTLCGHVELSPRGMPTWAKPYSPNGAVQNKATDAALAEQMSFTAAAGHACGLDFIAAEHLRQHPEFDWMKPLLRDMKAYPWTTFKAQ